MVMSIKCSNCCKVDFDHLRLSFNASHAVLMCRIGAKQDIIHAVCAYAQAFRKWPGCALIGACALIRTNTVMLQEANTFFFGNNFQHSDPRLIEPVCEKTNNLGSDTNRAVQSQKMVSGLKFWI